MRENVFKTFYKFYERNAIGFQIKDNDISEKQINSTDLRMELNYDKKYLISHNYQ